MDNLAHKMLHTFEKMDAINPTFELIQNTMKDNLIHDCLVLEEKKRSVFFHQDKHLAEKAGALSFMNQSLQSSYLYKEVLNPSI